MPLPPYSDRERAVNALHSLVGGPDRKLYAGSGVPAALHVPGADLVLCAGDNQVPLDVHALRPLAVERGCSVIGTYVDQMLSGHRIVVDVVVYADGTATLYPEYRVWVAGNAGADAALVPESGAGPVMRLSSAGLRLADAPPFATRAARDTDVARAQALLHRLIWDGTPYATPIARGRAR